MGKPSISKFLFCENPLDDNEHSYLIHCHYPQLLAIILHFHTHEDRSNAITGLPVYGTLDYADEYILLTPVKQYDEIPATQESADILATTMRQMADWYEQWLLQMYQA